MIGVTEQLAKKIFLELWPTREQDWDFEGSHFTDLCNRFGLEVVNDAKYDFKKRLLSGKAITNEQNFFFGCAKRIVAEKAVQQARIQKRAETKDESVPPGFDSYNAYYKYLVWQVQQDYPDTKEEATRRRQEWEAYQQRKRERLKDLESERFVLPNRNQEKEEEEDIEENSASQSTK